MLEVKQVVKNFGGLTALNKVHMRVSQSEILGLIGPNGSGKTTLFNVICGFYQATSGQVIFDGRNITNLKAHQIAQLGISRVFQSPTQFSALSVLDNVFTGYHMSYKTKIWKRLFRIPEALREERTFKRNALEMLDFAGLNSLKNEMAGNLSYGDQRILGVCISLATKPKLLLLDEPVAGMSPMERSNMVNLIHQIRDQGITVLIVEHDMKTIINLCDRLVCLRSGEIISEGLPQEVCSDECVIEAYLGNTECNSNAA